MKQHPISWGQSQDEQPEQECQGVFGISGKSHQKLERLLGSLFLAQAE
ncbi:hypothetical protein NDA01_29465 [Trichocoleus desertorum AS-A10]